jgi:glycerol-3-phosphate dehydrogenase
VHHLAFVIPVYRWWDGPFYGIGMKVYDRLAGRLGLAPSRSLSRDETVEVIPTVETEGLQGGVRYHDGQFDDARLAIDLVRTAEDLGATVVNYVRAIGLRERDGVVAGATVCDEETGAKFEIRARAVVNATGVFADELRRLDDPSAPTIIAPSQGAHLVLPKRFLPGDSAIMVPRTEDGRVLFAVPWHDRVVVGTTDVPVDGPSLEPRPLREELAFLMEHAARYLATDPAPEDVLSAFAGLRPLVRAEGAESTAALSRDHTIVVSDRGLVTITGGKWTTYRKMAEDVVDHAVRVAGLETRPCRTSTLPIHGCPDPDAPAVADPRLAHYGSDAAAVADLEAEMGDRPLAAGAAVTAGQVAWAARHEQARTVEDVLARRTRALLLDARGSAAAAAAVARVLASETGRDGDWQRRQVDDYAALAAGYTFESLMRGA